MILHCKAILEQGQSGLMRWFGFNHVPGAESIARWPIDQQSSVLPLSYVCLLKINVLKSLALHNCCFLFLSVLVSTHPVDMSLNIEHRKWNTTPQRCENEKLVKWTLKIALIKHWITEYTTLREWNTKNRVLRKRNKTTPIPTKKERKISKSKIGRTILVVKRDIHLLLDKTHSQIDDL